jgi:lipopolysaccharide transport system ATP-binding protein
MSSKAEFTIDSIPMTETVIQVENLAKRYIIGHQRQERYTALRDVIANRARALGKKLTGREQKTEATPQDFWALQGVSFTIKQGDRVGIIGRNGAGKSTLLKILSRITEPTRGRIQIQGRVASLLEVGTGFHPELTGRENIQLNGAILGMSRAEIKQKFDEIVAFAEVERFLDTPVKHYSSGMYVRLAFAVAAHLEPEILIVDEVLAVGDMQFQQKCLGKMQEVGQAGKTVLFVSHNMGVVSSLCNQGLYLSAGQVAYTGSMHSAIERYLMVSREQNLAAPGILYQHNPETIANEDFQILKITLLDENLELKSMVKTWDYCRIRIHYYSPRKVTNGSVELKISTSAGNNLIECSTRPLSGFELSFDEGNFYIDCVLPQLPLAAGSYCLTVGLAIPMIQWLCLKENIGFLEVSADDVYHSNFPPAQSRAPIAAEYFWENSIL